MKQIDELKARIIQVAQAMVRQDQIKTSGHVSARVDEGHFLVTGHIHEAGRSMADIAAEDIVLCNLKGEKIQGELDPPGEVYIHSCLYEARADVGGVIHAHPLFSTVLGIAGKHVIPVCTGGIIFAPQAPIFDDPNHVETKERGRALAKALENSPAIVIRGHGSVLVGKTPEQAAAVAIRLEDNAEMQFLASCIAEPRAILAKEVDSTLFSRVASLESARALISFYSRK